MTADQWHIGQVEGLLKPGPLFADFQSAARAPEPTGFSQCVRLRRSACKITLVDNTNQGDFTNHGKSKDLPVKPLMSRPQGRDSQKTAAASGRHSDTTFSDESFAVAWLRGPKRAACPEILEPTTTANSAFGRKTCPGSQSGSRAGLDIVLMKVPCDMKPACYIILVAVRCLDHCTTMWRLFW
jgi:hypothetical protein